MDDLLNAVATALGLDNVRALTSGGQKFVLEATLAGEPAIAKIVIVPDGPQGAIVLERAHREVELLSAVSAPTVVRVLSDAVEIDDPQNAVCWVEERLDGSDLQLHLGSHWSEADAWQLAGDLANALAACHELDVVHRDLSAGNVRRLPNGTFVLMDPGLARHLAKAALTGHFQPGTPGFRSPEHVPGGDPVPASDIFGLGILLWVALTGEFPIDPTGDSAEYDRRLLYEQVASLRSRRADLSDELVEVVDTCLQRQPARRYIDGAELEAHLSKLGRARK